MQIIRHVVYISVECPLIRSCLKCWLHSREENEILRLFHFFRTLTLVMILNGRIKLAGHKIDHFNNTYQRKSNNYTRQSAQFTCNGNIRYNHKILNTSILCIVGWVNRIACCVCHSIERQANSNKAITGAFVCMFKCRVQHINVQPSCEWNPLTKFRNGIRASWWKEWQMIWTMYRQDEFSIFNHDQNSTNHKQFGNE